MLPIGSIIKLGLVFAIIATLAGGVYYITGLRADLAISQANNEKLEEGLKDQEALIESIKKDMVQIQEVNNKLQEENAKQREDVNALAKKFDKRDFGVFAINQTEKAEFLINRGTKNVLRCLELATGAPLNEAERAANSPVEANRECPSLIDPNYKSILN